MADIKLYDNTPKGWLCPQCGKAHGPQVETCPEETGAHRVWEKPQMPFDEDARPFEYQNLDPKIICKKCGMIWQGSMGYYCPDGGCPVQTKVTC